MAFTKKIWNTKWDDDKAFNLHVWSPVFLSIQVLVVATSLILKLIFYSVANNTYKVSNAAPFVIYFIEHLSSYIILVLLVHFISSHFYYEHTSHITGVGLYLTGEYFN